MNTCNKCGKSFTRATSLRHHQLSRCDENCPIPKKRIRPLGIEVIDGSVSKLTHAFKNRIASFRITSTHSISHSDFLDDIKPKVLGIINDHLQRYTSLKINFELFGIYVKPDAELSDIKSMNTKNEIVTVSSNLNKIFEKFKEDIMVQASEFQEKDSNWSLQEILFLDVNINRYSAIAASSYIQLPWFIKKKCAALNIKNIDNKCFAWCVNAAIFPATGDPANPESYPPYDFDFDNIEFPIKLSDIKRFEKLNNISVNVYGLDTYFKGPKKQYEVVGPLHFTSQRKPTHVNLLLLIGNDQSHYCLITDLSRLVRSQKTTHETKLHFCDGCLQSFNTTEKLSSHQENDCTHVYTKLPSTDLKINKCGEQLPENILKFVNIEKKLPVPFVIYADFESLLMPLQGAEPYDGKSFTTRVAEYVPYSFAFYVKCNYDDRLSQLVTYEGEDAAQIFVQKLDTVVHDLYNHHLKHVKPMLPLTKEEKKIHENATLCYLCQKSFNLSNRKVRDHYHLTGQYRGPAHNSCNINYKISNTIPVFFHNLSNYDYHLFIKELSTKGERVSVIAQTKEKYISFSKAILVEKAENKHVYMSLRFVDSFRFLAKSLDNLSTTLDSSQCVEVKKHFPDINQFELMRRKGVFPYSHIDTIEKLKENQLPSKDKFYNTLTSEHISDEDFERAQEVWDIFKCQSLSDYAMLYLKSDVLLLADVFENFRKVCLKEYHLDPCQYVTAPSLSWDAMLYKTKIQLELLTDIDMVNFFKKGIRGGVAQCSKREAVANNQYVSNFDPQKPEKYIMYLDATNLYGSAMSQYLPYGGFRWLHNEIQNFDINIDDESPQGYVLEVDLEYPAHLHDAHNDLPFCPESIAPPKSKIKKLIPNLYNKTKYIIHYRNLKQCLRHGLKLKKIHRVLKFNQSPWLKNYIDLNTSLRNNAKNEFEKDLFKLLVNAIFGKTMENIEKRINVRLCTRWTTKTRSIGARALIAKPEFKSCSVFNENLVAVQLGKTKIIHDKPLYVGFSILDISKTVIYNFYYGYIKSKYGEDATLLYTDTDSLILEICTPNFYENMKENLHYFDTSNYPVDNIHGISKTKSILGKMKDEFASAPIKSFYGTGAKAYCVEANKLLKKAKGVSKHITKHQLQLSDYVRIVKDGGTIFRKMYVFVSDMHTIYTELRNKVALSAKDDKRYVIPGDVKTLAWGHLLLNPPGTLDDLLAAMDEMDPKPMEDLVEEEPTLDDIPLDDLFIISDFEYNTYLSISSK
ncbi:unnamed protein product [Psylliodes chrysocephalus]|uniref:C2H2-type domain-containing protein n=1 Tax=Psylliodes chrysocephalus TaxID=3402493 RepID=A0A9P0CSR4_9CUCU|nr:unnamed protein product [Psylliodes chrysocephala]